MTKIDEDKLEIPYASIKILATDYTPDGLVKGDLVYTIMEKLKQPLFHVAAALHDQGVWYSIRQFIQACKDNGKYGSWACKKMIVKSIKECLPEMFHGDEWPSQHKQIKAEIRRVYERQMH